MHKPHSRRQIQTTIFSLLVIVVMITSCYSKQKFDKTKWAEVGDLMTFPNRNSMVDDLIKNHSLKGKTFNDVIVLLGQPQYPLDSTMKIGYKIDEDYRSDIDPVYTKTLLIQFDKDTIAKQVEIQEWKK